MSQDEQFRRTFDLLADRLIEELSTQLKRVGHELATSAEAERARTVADAVLAARADAERQTADRIAAAEAKAQESEAAAEARVREAVAAAEERARIAIAAAEERSRAAIAAIEVRANEEIAAAEARANDAVNRAESLAQEALAAADTRTRDSVAAVEAQARALVSAAEARAHDAVAAVESRAKADVEAAVARVCVEATAEMTAASERLASAVRALDAGGSLSDIMNTLVRCARAEAPRVGIFVREGTALRSWKLIGFDRQADAPLDVTLDEAGIVADALQTAQVTLAGPAFQASVPAFAQLPPDRTALAVPLVISREVIGVLYADAGSGDGAAHPAWTSTIEVLGRHATRALEVLTASKLLAQAMAARPATAAGVRPGGVAAR